MSNPDLAWRQLRICLHLEPDSVFHRMTIQWIKHKISSKPYFETVPLFTGRILQVDGQMMKLEDDTGTIALEMRANPFFTDRILLYFLRPGSSIACVYVKKKKDAVGNEPVLVFDASKILYVARTLSVDEKCPDRPPLSSSIKFKNINGVEILQYKQTAFEMTAQDLESCNKRKLLKRKLPATQTTTTPFLSTLNSKRSIMVKTTSIKLNLCPSLLLKEQIEIFHQFCKHFKVQLSPFYTSDVTHVIINAVNGRIKLTVKYILAILKHKRVVTFGWIEKCMSEMKIVAEDPFEAWFLDLQGQIDPEDAITRSILSDYSFSFPNSDRGSCMRQYQMLVMEMGGAVGNEIDKQSIGQMYEVVERDSKKEQNAKYKTIVYPDWILKCFAAKKVLPLED